MDSQKTQPKRKRSESDTEPDHSCDESTPVAPPLTKKTKTTSTEIEIPKNTKLTKTRSERERLAEFRRLVDNIVVFHTEKEVEDNLTLIMEDTINRIVTRIGFGWYLNMVTIPHVEIRDVFKKVVFESVQEPLRVLIRTYPKQAKQMVDVSSSVPKDGSLVPEINKILTAGDEKETTDPSSFASMLCDLEEIRNNLVKRIVAVMYSDKMWTSMMVNPMKKISKKSLVVDICSTIFTTLCPFARDFSRFFVDDEVGFNDDLNAALEGYGFD